MKKDNIKETWYLLYSGESADGRGFPSLTGRTLEITEAAKHLKSIDNPYCFGHVIIMTQDKIYQINSIREFDDYYDINS